MNFTLEINSGTHFLARSPVYLVAYHSVLIEYISKVWSFLDDNLDQICQCRQRGKLSSEHIQRNRERESRKEKLWLLSEITPSLRGSGK